MITKTKYKTFTGEIEYSLTGPEGLVIFEDDAGFAWLDGDYDPSSFKVVNGQAVPLSNGEKEALEISEAWVKLRSTRDQLLASCDWTQVPDAPVDHSLWAVYRQALRDLPSNTTDPRNPVWPTPPNS